MSTDAAAPTPPSEPGPDSPGPDSPGLGPNEREVEQPPTDRSTIDVWAALLAGPVIWISHFMVVYLAAEAACVADDGGIDFVGEHGLVVGIVAATAVAVAAVVAIGAWAWRRARTRHGDDGVLGWAGVVLSAGSIVAILAVALPALVLDPC